MTNNFIPALPRHALYCVWITTGDSSRPLECVWIDPEFRSFQFMDIQQTTETGAKAMRGSPKAVSAEQSDSVPSHELHQETPLAIRPLALVLSLACLLLAMVVLAPFCFGQADVHVTPRVVRGPAGGGVGPHYEEAEPLKANVDLVLVPVT